MTGVTMKMRAQCGCPTCMFELGQAAFAYLVDQAGGFVTLPLEALQKMESEGVQALSAEVKSATGEVLIRAYTADEMVKEMARREC